MESVREIHIRNTELKNAKVPTLPKIVLKPFYYLDSETEEKVYCKGVQYTGCNMDSELIERFPDSFTMGITSGSKALMVKSERCLRMPFSGYWLFWDAEGNKLISVLTEKEAQKLMYPVFE
ncbi:MAG: hypothetical protein RR203_07890 [Synergistaceae bacterium]